MSDREYSNSTREDRVGEAVAWYYQSAEAGAPPEPGDFLTRFSDLRPELESFLADKGAFDRAAGPPAPARMDPDGTLPPSANNDTATLPPSGDPNATVARADTGAEGSAAGSLGSVRYFGDYELLSEIARGGMGVVFRARQVSLNREVALKMILTGQLASSADVSRFRAEAEAAANLDHPNVLPIYEVGEHHGQQYFAMKLVPGGSLAGKIEGWVNDPKAAVPVFVKVCRAVEFAHRRGILHRDLKPGNILMDADGTPFVTDFGLAKKVDGDSNLTQSGAIVGTPSYMAPEQARAEKGLTTAADVYALGAILYELLTGRPPFRGPTVLDTILQVLEKDAPDPRVVNPKADRDLSVIALKCLEKNPGSRYESAGSLADDLDRWARGEPILARPVGRTERARKWIKRNPVVTGLLVTVAASLLAGGIVGYVNYRDARDQEGVARERAEDAAREAAEARRQEAIAGEHAAEAKRQEGIAQTEARRARDAASDLSAELTESRRLLDLARLRDAQAAFNKNLVQVAREKLDEIRPENRCLAWWLLTHRFEGSVFTLREATGTVNCATVSADGTRIVTGSRHQNTGPAQIWDARTGRLLLELTGHKGAVTGVAVSADGARVVTGSMDTTARVWDARTGRLLLELTGHTGAVLSVAVSADGTRVVTGSVDETARVWDTRTGRPPLVLKPREVSGGWREVRSVGVSADGSRVVTGADEARVWDGQTGQLLFRLRASEGRLDCAAISADGSQIATSCYRERLLWDACTGQRLLELREQGDRALSISFGADGSRVVTGSTDGAARVWDVRTGRLALELKGHTHPVKCAVLSGDGARVVTVADDVRVWDARVGRTGPQFDRRTPAIVSMAVSADGARVVAGASDGTARVWDGRSGQLLFVLAAGKSAFGSVRVAVNQNGSRAVTDHTVDRTARVWDTHTGRPILELPGGSGVAISADGARIVAGSRVWDATGRLIVAFEAIAPPEVGVSAFASNTDVSRVVAGHSDGTVRVWDARSGRLLLKLAGRGMVRCVAVSADGAQIVTDTNQKIGMWDARTGRLIRELKGQAGNLSSLAINADGTRIVTGSMDGTFRVWDAKTGQSLIELPEQGGGTSGGWFSAVLSANGAWVVTGSDDSARLWEAKSERGLLDLARRSPAGVSALDGAPHAGTLAADEVARRLWLTRPDPDWHVLRQEELAAVGNTYGAALHRSFEHRARGVLALEAGDFDRAWGHFVVAAALAPAPPTPPAIVPPAPATIPLAK
jgi:WD40 repeat protein